MNGVLVIAVLVGLVVMLTRTSGTPDLAVRILERAAARGPAAATTEVSHAATEPLPVPVPAST